MNVLPLRLNRIHLRAVTRFKGQGCTHYGFDIVFKYIVLRIRKDPHCYKQSISKSQIQIETRTRIKGEKKKSKQSASDFLWSQRGLTPDEHDIPSPSPPSALCMNPSVSLFHLHILTRTRTLC